MLVVVYVVEFQEPSVEKYGNHCLSLVLALETRKRSICQPWSCAAAKSCIICATSYIKDCVSKISRWK
jgi:hypothetical protein